MKKIHHILDEQKGQNPFRMPDGYLESLTDQVMSKLPEKQEEETLQISLKERIMPWLYLAAVFAGMALLIPYILEKGTSKDPVSTMANIRSTTETTDTETTEANEDDYMDFMEERYVDLLLSDELTLIGD